MRKSYFNLFFVVQDGITPLMYASKTGELEVAKILLQKFAKIDIEENVHVSSLYCLSLCSNLSFRTFNGLLLILPFKENIKMW